MAAKKTTYTMECVKVTSGSAMYLAQEEGPITNLYVRKVQNGGVAALGLTGEKGETFKLTIEK